MALRDGKSVPTISVLVVLALTTALLEAFITKVPVFQPIPVVRSTLFGIRVGLVVLAASLRIVGPAALARTRLPSRAIQATSLPPTATANGLLVPGLAVSVISILS